jgi:hypothetical protein
MEFRRRRASPLDVCTSVLYEPSPPGGDGYECASYGGTGGSTCCQHVALVSSPAWPTMLPHWIVHSAMGQARISARGSPRADERDPSSTPDEYQRIRNSSEMGACKDGNALHRSFWLVAEMRAAPTEAADQVLTMLPPWGMFRYHEYERRGANRRTTPQRRNRSGSDRPGRRIPGAAFHIVRA